MAAINVINTVGRRKTAVARAYVKDGVGNIIINGRTLEHYFPSKILQKEATKPLTVTEKLGTVDIKINVHGGGISGQAGAVSLSIARALVEKEPDLKPTLRTFDLMTRDPRMVERKKFGRAKARKKFQFSKR